MEKKIFNKIKKYDTIVIARHIGPDPDAICSTLALRDSIRLTFPNKKVYAVGATVARFRCFGTLDKIEDIHDNALLIVLDVPNIYRIDGVNFTDYKEVIKIDHHPFEDKMGELEIIDETASSACELVASLIFNTKLLINKEVAQNLYLGIVSDSDRFLFSTTSANPTYNPGVSVKSCFSISCIVASWQNPFSAMKFSSSPAGNAKSAIS